MATSPPLLPEPVPSSGLAVMEEDTGEETARMKELEEMVKKLKIENEQLLNQVTKGADENVVSSSLPNGNAASDTNGRVTTPTKSSRLDDDNDDILETISNREVDEDTWLYVSPLRPPTKEHRKISPSQWLSEGKMRQRGQYRERSFQDIKKSLAYAMSETEVEKPPSKSLVSKGRASPTNKTAQKYLNDVRQRRSSQSESDDSATERGGPSSPSRSPVGTNQAHTFTRKPRNVPVRPVIPGQAPPRKARVPPGIENDGLSAFKVKKWDPSKIQHNSDEEDEEEETVQPAKRWQVKQVPNNDGVPIVNKWKVKQVPETGPGEEGQDATQEKERKWKVKQVPDSTVPAKEERDEEEEEIPKLRRKWKVRQVPDRHDNEEEEEEEEVPLQRKRKVKQVHDVEGEGEAVPQQRKWKVKQVHDNQEDEEEVQPQKIWKVKQVPDHHGNEEEEEEEELPQRKWAVKQVTGNDTRETTPTQEVKRKETYTLEDEEVGVADEEEGEGLHPKLERKGTYTAVPDTGEGEGEGEGGEVEEGNEGEGDGEKKQATVKRSGTFTKDKPKVYARRPDNECGRDSSASDRTMSPVEAENLKIKWTPRNPSPASGDEGKRTRTQSPASPRGSPDQQIRVSRYSDYQAQIKQQPSVGGGRGQLRSPVARQGLPSPLRQQRQAEGGVASSPYVSPNKQVTPRLRPPSPRRSSQLPSNDEETTPTRVTTNQTTPTSHTPRATGNQTTPTGQTLRSVGLSPRGGKVKGTSPGGIKLAKPLTTSPQAPPQGRVSQPAQQPQRRRVLPAAQSTKGMSPRGGAKASKPQRGGGEGRTRMGTRPSPSPKQDDSWLDECF